MAKRWEEVQCELHADKAGVLWDLLLCQRIMPWQNQLE